jgi:hypothetical protein
MAFAIRHPMLLLLVALSLLAAGCKGRTSPVDPEIARQDTDLTRLHEIISGYVKNNQRPPKQVSDLRKYDPIHPGVLPAVEKGTYTVVWGVSTEKSSTAVLAYEKDAPQQGGVVLLANGTVKKMSADELQTALKGKG